MGREGICKFCGNTANYRLLYQRKSQYCVDHKPKNAIASKTKNCCAEGCKRRTKFNVKYCLTHRDNYIRCAHEGCLSKFAHYFHPIESTKKYCVLHKTSKMITSSFKLCSEPGCYIRTYNISIKDDEWYCSIHRQKTVLEINDIKSIVEYDRFLIGELNKNLSI